MNAPKYAELSPDGDVRRLRMRILELEQEVSQLRGSHTIALIRQLMEDAPVGFAFFDPEFRYQVVNRRLAEINGTAAALHIGRTLEEIVPDLAAQARSAIRQVMETGRPVPDLEMTDAIEGTPATPRCWSASWFPVHAAEGQLLGVACVMIEVTGRKVVEEALRVSQQRLVLAQAAAGIEVWDWDARFGHTYCSPGFGRLYGVPFWEFAPTMDAWLELIHPEDRARVHDGLIRALAVEQYHSDEYRVVWPDGSVHWLMGKGEIFRDARGTAIRMLGVNMDITERKRAEGAMHESEERFRIMADTAPVMIWVTGPDKMATFFNRQWLEFGGRSSEQELGDGWMVRLHPDEKEQCLRKFAAAFEARGQYQEEHRLRRADGEFRWLLCTGVPRFTEDHQLVGYVGCSLDITDHRLQQEQLLAAQKLESLGILAGGIAHDFNNMLAAIITTSEAVAADSSNESQVQSGVRDIRAVAVRAAEIVRQMMAYTGQEKEGFEAVDISQVVAEMLHLLKVSIAKQATLQIALGEDLPPVLANPAQIRQVVMNLITNGSEAMESKPGVLTLSTTRVEGDRDHIRLEVNDTGTGMTDEVRERIFDPFFTTKFTGRGLGLAAVQGIIRGHGGTIRVTSAPGQGSRFEILLPCARHIASAEAADPSPEESAAPAVNGRPSATILVVEDEEVLRGAVAKLLAKAGYSILESADGASAVEMFRANGKHIDAILLDMTLPGLPGPRVLEEVRRIQPDVRVVVTTAYSRDEFAEVPGLHAGYLQKPYQIRDVIGMLQTLLANQPQGAHD
jgi:PAS domain S-box-containing protein